MTNKHEQHVRVLQEMRRVMIEDDNWENLKRFIEAVTAGGMAIQMLDEKAFTQPKTGHWIEDTNGTYTDNHDTWECSKCGHAQILLEGTPKDNDYNYCPNCGAKMKGDTE